MTDPAEKACRNCKFAILKEGRSGPFWECHRYPPTFKTTSDNNDAPSSYEDWPEVDELDWCGEFLIRDYEKEL